MARILVIEDERGLADGLCNSLEVEGHIAEAAYTGMGGLKALSSRGADLLILDLMLPDTNGYCILRKLREEGFDLPILMLTARGREADKVRSFRLGADDCVPKPFGMLELLARIEALLRRAGLAKKGSRFRIGETEVDASSHTVFRNGQQVEMTPKEFGLLLALHRQAGQTVSRQDLLREVWGHSSVVVTRTVDMHIHFLRRKLELNPNRPRHIITAPKYGYRLVV